MEDSVRSVKHINEEDFNKLFKKPLYQSSIYVKDIRKIDNTIQELNNIGIKAKKVTDYKVMFDDFKLELEGLKIAKLTITIILLVTLFSTVGCLFILSFPVPPRVTP